LAGSSFFTGTLEISLASVAAADGLGRRRMISSQKALKPGKAEHLPALFRDIFRNAFLKFRDGRILTVSE
jgi:hypothetical protein